MCKPIDKISLGPKISMIKSLLQNLNIPEGNGYSLNWARPPPAPAHPNSYVEALTPSVVVLGDWGVPPGAAAPGAAQVLGAADHTRPPGSRSAPPARLAGAWAAVQGSQAHVWPLPGPSELPYLPGHLDSRTGRLAFPASCLPRSQLCPGRLGLAVPQTSWVMWLRKGWLAGRPHRGPMDVASGPSLRGSGQPHPVAPHDGPCWGLREDRPQACLL